MNKLYIRKYLLYQGLAYVICFGFDSGNRAFDLHLL